MSFLDKLKKKAEELDLKTKADHLAEQAKEAAQQAKEKAGELAHENRDKVEDLVEKAGSVIDDKTGGKYTDKIAKAKEQVAKGVDKVAEGRPVSDVPGPDVTGAAGTTTPPPPTGAPAAGTTPPPPAAPTPPPPPATTGDVPHRVETSNAVPDDALSDVGGPEATGDGPDLDRQG